MSKKLQIGSLVWAKMRGFPWWPGIVISIQIASIPSEHTTKYNVNFIGENTQQILISARLDQKNVQAFRKFYNKHAKTKKPVWYMQYLIRVVKIACEIESGKLDARNLAQINESLQNGEPASRILSFDQSIAELHQKLDMKINEHQQGIRKLKMTAVQLQQAATRTLETAFDTWADVQYTLLEQHREEKISYDALCHAFGQLITANASPKNLASCKIVKTVKLVRKKLQRSDSGKLKNLAEIARKLYLYWKLILVTADIDASIPNKAKSDTTNESEYLSNVVELSNEFFDDMSGGNEEEYIANKGLRKGVCQKIAQVLQEKQYTEVNAQQTALLLERNLRRRDPTMQKRYTEQYRILIRQLYGCNP